MSNPYNAPAADLSQLNQDDSTYDPEFISIKGRIGRLRYLAYSVGMGLILMAVAMVFGIVAAFTKSETMLTLVMFIVGVPAFAITFILAIRRLNDMDQTGWWSLLMVIPFVSLFLMLWLVFGPGNAGSNRYGQAPSKNSTLVIVGALALPVLGLVIGILAAIAIPQYQNYVTRAKAAQEQQQQQPQLEQQAPSPQ